MLKCSPFTGNMTAFKIVILRSVNSQNISHHVLHHDNTFNTFPVSNSGINTTLFVCFCGSSNGIDTRFKLCYVKANSPSGQKIKIKNWSTITEQRKLDSLLVERLTHLTHLEEFASRSGNRAWP